MKKGLSNGWFRYYKKIGKGAWEDIKTGFLACPQLPPDVEEYSLFFL